MKKPPILKAILTENYGSDSRCPSNMADFVTGFRSSSPYINAFRGRVFVISFSGAAIDDPGFSSLIHDFSLLNSLGIKLVLVHGIRPQVEKRLMDKDATINYVNTYRVTDDIALNCVKEAVGIARVEIEGKLSMGLANSPMAGARIRVASGNFVTARPLGVRDGVDYLHTGEVRRIDVSAIHHHLDSNEIVLLSPLGYSPTGEVFNLTATEVATSTAVALNADKLICLTEEPALTDLAELFLHHLNPEEAGQILEKNKTISELLRTQVQGAIHVCRHGVSRAHLIDRHIDGALLLELFTRDGIGTMITGGAYEGRRQASIDDVGGILNLIIPLEETGALVKRSREQLEMEIEQFTVIDRDGTIIACAALHPHDESAIGELACLAVHPDYRKAGYGKNLLDGIERRAIQIGLKQLFILTTMTSHWFREHGFEPAEISDLPLKRKELYNFQRKSKVLIKHLA